MGALAGGMSKAFTMASGIMAIIVSAGALSGSESQVLRWAWTRRTRIAINSKAFMMGSAKMKSLYTENICVSRTM